MIRTQCLAGVLPVSCLEASSTTMSYFEYLNASPKICSVMMVRKIAVGLSGHLKRISELRKVADLGGQN